VEQLLVKPLEAAEALGMGRTVFYRLVKAGVIPSCRIGKSIRIPVSALKSWAERQGPGAPELSSATKSPIEPIPERPEDRRL
jgi:excisionase family DNA binding protein